MKTTHIYIAGLLLASLAAPCMAQDDPNDLSDKRRLTFGARIQAYPLKMFKTSVQTTNVVKPATDTTYTGSTESPKVGFGPTLEFRLTNHISVGAEGIFHRIQYKEVKEIRDGATPASGATDSRRVATFTETTRANTWEVPILARYYGFRERGIFSRLYAAGGISFRRTTNIRTGNEISNFDTTTDYNEKPATPSKPNQMGGVVGFGIRFIDNIGIRIAPEVRYTRWQGYNFSGTSYKAVQQDIQGGISVSF